MKTAAWACGGAAGAALAVYIFVAEKYQGDGTTIWDFFFPVWWAVIPAAAVLVLGGLALVFAIVATLRKPKKTTKATPAPTPGIRISVPGLTRHGRMVAIKNIRNNSHRVEWDTNGAEVGRLVPGERGGFDVEHGADGHLGWAASVTDGMAILETHETTPAPAPARIQLSRYFEPQRFHENPLNVILESYNALEGWFDQTLTKHGIDNYDGLRKLSTEEMAEVAVHRGLIGPRSLTTIQGLGILRELAIQKRGDRVTPDEARTYVTQTDAQIYTLDRELEAYEADH